MKRPVILAILCVTLLILVAGWSFGKDKNDKPDQERFEAYMNPSITSNNRVSMTIWEFSSDQEMQALAQTFAQGGGKALEKALDEINKGRFRIGDERTMSLFIVTSSQEGETRKLNLIGKAPSIFVPGYGGSGTTEHRGFPYTFIQLQLDGRGHGTGVLVLYADLTFDAQGRISLKAMERRTFRLDNVRKR